jgi:hypothetical protein
MSIPDFIKTRPPVLVLKRAEDIQTWRALYAWVHFVHILQRTHNNSNREHNWSRKHVS